jgi:hypothetical protein
MRFSPNRQVFLAAFLAMLLTLQGVASAQIASALLRENEPLPGDMLGTMISSINNTAVNGTGGYAFTVNTDLGPTSFSHIWGNATGGPGDIIVSEGTYGDLQQTSFESFLGFSDAGVAGYSAISNDTNGGATSLDGVWTNETVILNELDPISSLPGQFSTFNSRTGMTADGQVYWVGGFSNVQGGGTQNRALFFGPGATVVLMGGDSIAGVPEPVSTDSTGIDFDVRFSALGTNYILPSAVDSGSSLNDTVMVLNGAALMAAGGIVREQSPVPPEVGGLPGELYQNFDFLGVTEAGSYLITGNTNAAAGQDEFVMLDGIIVLREGAILDGGTLSGSIEGGYLNEDGDWAVIWDVDNFSGNREALIVNGRVVVQELSPVDWNGDGTIDAGDQNAFITDFTGITSLTLGRRDGDDNVDVLFTADCDVNGTILEGGFRLSVNLAPPIVHVDSFVVTEGTYVSGGLAELAESDNLDLNARRNNLDVQSRVFVEFLSQSPTELPTRFDFTFEAAVFARSQVVQSIDLFDFQNGVWEEVDSRDASGFSDLVTEISPGGNLARFVQPITLGIKARVRFQSVNPRQKFTALIDQAIWIIE